MNRIPSLSFRRLHEMIGEIIDTGHGYSVRITGHSAPGSMFCESLDPAHPQYEISSGLVELAMNERNGGAK